MHDLLCKACADRAFVYNAKGGIFYIKLYVRAIRTLEERSSKFIRDNPIFSSERMLHKDYDRNGSVAKKIRGRESQGVKGFDAEMN
jgi:hypothetical protein